MAFKVKLNMSLTRFKSSFRPGLALGLIQEIILFNSRLEKSDTILINVLETQFNKFLFKMGFSLQ